jgi:preprotein translocase subunit SecA
MIQSLVRAVFPSRKERLIRQYRKKVARINALGPALQGLSDAELTEKTVEFRARFAQGESLTDLLPEAFAVVREASARVLGMRHFDVQLIGGMVLHAGKISEMRTGEGKTLMSTLPVYLNAIAGQGVHVVTPNDYLAQRDADWMRPIYTALGLSVGVNLPELSTADKRAAYAADITYGTNNEFGFDYLRDNMVLTLADRVQRELAFCVIDEVDSILIDEARTPLIISGAAEDASEWYVTANQLVPQLILQTVEEKDDEPVDESLLGDYTVDEKTKQVFLTDRGHARLETLMTEAGLIEAGGSLYDVNHIHMMHYLNAALRAHALFRRDVDYVVADQAVQIIDEHTGRLMEGRRWSDGLHQAIEVKEGVPVQLENQTLATITFQNYFRLYDKLSGMTGTADTEAFELQKIYGLEVVIVPTHRPMVRQDRTDQVYLTVGEKYEAIISDIRACQAKGQPVLVGAASVESSEQFSALLTQKKIKHAVLNAKHHAREASIIAEAGKPGAVTIATSMAGRGTDIVLGGNLSVELAALGESATAADQEALRADWQSRHDAVLAAGGLYVLGTERHESRRIDNQLRGRAGRQGDPGASQFYLSFDDHLLRIFVADSMANLMRRLGLEKGEVIQNRLISRAIENAQRRVEGLNFDMRKQLLDYDDVASDQRKVIYQQRSEILVSDQETVQAYIHGMWVEVATELLAQFMPEDQLEDAWDLPGLQQALSQDFNVDVPVADWLEEASVESAVWVDRIVGLLQTAYDEKVADLTPVDRHAVESSLLLQVLDKHWKEHLSAMDYLRQSIHLRGYAQKNPAQEYKRESFLLFTNLLACFKYDVLSHLLQISVANAAPESAPPPMTLHYHHPSAHVEAGEGPHDVDALSADASAETIVRGYPKVGRNALCPCESGKKYKHCHGKLV